MQPSVRPSRGGSPTRLVGLLGYFQYRLDNKHYINDIKLHGHLLGESSVGLGWYLCDYLLVK